MERERREAAQSPKKSHPIEARGIRDAVQEVISAGPPDYMALSIAAKTYWIVNESGAVPISVNKITDQAAALKWKITTEQVKQRQIFWRDSI